MDAKTLFKLLKPHLDSMKLQEKKSLSALILNKAVLKTSKRRKILSLSGVKEKLQTFRKKEVERERLETFENARKMS